MIAKVEWHPGELVPRVGFIVTNMSRPAERVVAFYNKRGTCEQWIKEGKGVIKWTRLSCRSFTARVGVLMVPSAQSMQQRLGVFTRPYASWDTTRTSSSNPVSPTAPMIGFRFLPVSLPVSRWTCFLSRENRRC